MRGRKRRRRKKIQAPTSKPSEKHPSTNIQHPEKLQRPSSKCGIAIVSSGANFKRQGIFKLQTTMIKGELRWLSRRDGLKAEKNLQAPTSKLQRNSKDQAPN